MPLLFWLCSLCCCHFRCLRSVSDQQPCCLCLQCLQWSTSTFLQSVLASSIPCSSAFLCALEVREITSVLLTILTPLWFYCILTISHPDLLENSAKPNKHYYSVCVLTHTKTCYVSLHSSFHYAPTFISHPLTVMFNFILHDQRKGPIWNIIMWTSLFLGQGVIICLYSQEWYAQRYCPLKEVTPAALLCVVWWNVALQTLKCCLFRHSNSAES